jgi:hypothetical protein
MDFREHEWSDDRHPGDDAGHTGYGANSSSAKGWFERELGIRVLQKAQQKQQTRRDSPTRDAREPLPENPVYVFA